jgi:hypothetical protein
MTRGCGPVGPCQEGHWLEEGRGTWKVWLTVFGVLSVSIPQLQPKTLHMPAGPLRVLSGRFRKGPLHRRDVLVARTTLQVTVISNVGPV